jgi:type VI secretion system protein ImpL
MPDFSVAGAAGPNAPRSSSAPAAEPLSRGVPGLFTRDGYLKAVPAGDPARDADAGHEESWVMGLKHPFRHRLRPTPALGTQTSSTKVRRLYFEEYIKTWDRYLDDVRLVAGRPRAGDGTCRRPARRPDSPLAYMIAVAA